MNKKVSWVKILMLMIFIIFISYMVIDFDMQNNAVHEYYQVYLNGKTIGLIESSDELYDLIDKEQEHMKEKFGVDKIYPPSGLEVQKVNTYKSKLMSAKSVYEEIKDLDPFTIEGYRVKVTSKDKSKSKVFYILNKDDLDSAVKNTVLSFVSEEDYNDYLKGVEKDRDEEGKSITNIYFESDITIKKVYISTEENIITDENTMKMYFLFGTTELMDKYKVKASDTIESIAYNNKLGVEDLLVANPEIKGENALLAIGQEVTVAAINPISNIVVESFDTEIKDIDYDTQIEYDTNLSADQMYVKQEGMNGKSKVVYATTETNGVILDTVMVSEDVISEAVDKIVVAGSKGVYYVGDTTYWVWPTSKPYRIASCYGYRNHPIKGNYHFHPALDISGTKSRNIYAIQSGTVTQSFCDGGWHTGAGNNIKIKHNDTYTSWYMHLNKCLVKAGDHVEKGQLIAIMGATGSATGVHLDFRVYKNGNLVNPFSLYYKRYSACRGL